MELWVVILTTVITSFNDEHNIVSPTVIIGTLFSSCHSLLSFHITLKHVYFIQTKEIDEKKILCLMLASQSCAPHEYIELSFVLLPFKKPNFIHLVKTEKYYIIRLDLSC